MRLLVRFGINAAAVWATTAVLPGLKIEVGFGNVLIVALVFGLVNTLIRPVARMLTLPAQVVTLGLFALVVNGFMLIITTWIVDVFSLEGGVVERFLTAVGAAVIISLVSTVISWLVLDSRSE